MERNKISREYLLFTSSNFPKGGAGATYLNLFCKGMKMNSYNVKVYLLKGYAFGNSSEKISRKNVTNYGVPFTYLGLTNRPHNFIIKLFDDILSFLKLFILFIFLLGKRKQTTILVYHADFFHSLLLYLGAFIFKINIITFVPEYFNKADFRGISGVIKWTNFIISFKYLNRFSTGLIVFSNYLRNIYIGSGIDKDRIIVQPNLTDFKFWEPENNELRYTIGYSGTPTKKDGLHDLFKAISQIKEIPVSLLVIGDSTFGRSLVPELISICKNLGIEQNVFFTGLVESEQVKSYLASCKMVAITRPKNTQTHAGFPTKLGEYMALKKPVLATDFGEIEHYFMDGEDIIIARSGNPDSIAEKIQWMLDNEAELIKISNNGYQKAFHLLEYRTAMKRALAFIDKW